MNIQIKTKNFILSVFIPLVLTACLALVGIIAVSHPVKATDGVWTGNGTQSSPYLVSDITDLQKLATDVNSGNNHANTYFKLTADISQELGSSSWTPIGSETRPFGGNFDGDGHYIATGIIGSPSMNCVGLFGCISYGTIKNLTVSGFVRGNAVVGSIVGLNFHGTVENCTNTSNVYGTMSVGGIVGLNEKGLIKNCYSNPSTITIITTNTIVIHIPNTIIRIVNGTQSVGGIAGYNNGTIENCHSNVQTTGTELVGGIVGLNNEFSTVIDCYNTGTVNGSDGVGGIVGSNYGIIENCNNTGAISGANYIGGIVGENSYGSSILGCYNTGEISCKIYYSGGVAGINYNTITNCYNIGAVTGTDNVGGVVGNNFFGSSIFSCYNTGAITSTAYSVGGVVGVNAGTIGDCYNTGAVTGREAVGGVVGWNYFSNSILKNCYNTGTVTGLSFFGGIVGDNLGSVTACYYDNEAFTGVGLGTISSSTSMGRSTAEMTSSSFATTMGVAFEKRITDADYCYYPELKAFKTDGDTIVQAASKESVTVSRRTPVITNIPSTTEIRYGQALSASILSGGNMIDAITGVPVIGTVTWADGASIFPTVSNSNTTFYTYIFTPTTYTDLYKPAYGTVQMLVLKTDLIITADSKSKAYGDDNPVLSISYSGLVNGDTAASFLDPPSCRTIATNTSSVGTYPITLLGGTFDNYNIIFVPGTLTVDKAPLTLTADSKSKTYGTNNPALTFQYSGFVNYDDENVLTTKPSISTAADNASPAGIYPIVVSGGIADNYIFKYIDATLTVNKATLYVTADDKSKTANKDNPELTFQYSGFVYVEDESVLTTKPSISTVADKASPAGTYPIVVSGGIADNYIFEYIDGTLTINQSSNMIPWLLIGGLCLLMLAVAILIIIKHRRSISRK